MNPEPIDPTQALNLAQQSRSRLAQRELSPWWYAPVYGLGVGVIVASPGVRAQLIPLATFVGLAITLGAYAAWSRRTGVSVSSFREGRTRLIAVALLAFVLLCSGLGLLWKHEGGVAWAPLAAGVVAGLGAAVGSRLWDRAWLAELRQEA